MKVFKKICIALNLVLFLGSSLFMTVSSFMANGNEKMVNHFHAQLSSKHQSMQGGSLQQVSEKNESEQETENDVEQLVCYLPFYFSTVESDISYAQTSFIEAPASIQSYPIYLGICNFRI